MVQYGNRSTGWLFYTNQPIDFIEASHEVYFERKLMESYLCNLQHCFMSMEGQAESYNDLWWATRKVDIIQRFLNENPAVGKHFDREMAENHDEFECPLGEVWGTDRDQGSFLGMQDLHCKSLSQVDFLV